MFASNPIFNHQVDTNPRVAKGEQHRTPPDLKNLSRVPGTKLGQSVFTRQAVELHMLFQGLNTNHVLGYGHLEVLWRSLTDTKREGPVAPGCQNAQDVQPATQRTTCVCVCVCMFFFRVFAFGRVMSCNEASNNAAQCNATLRGLL